MPEGLSPLAAEFQINSYDSSNQDGSSVAYIPAQQGQAGYFGIIYESFGFSNAENDVLYAAVGLDGTVLLNDIALLPTDQIQDDPELIVLSDGRPVILWEDNRNIQTESDTFTLVGTTDGANPLIPFDGGASRPVMRRPDGGFEDVHATPLANGGYAFAANYVPNDTGIPQVYVRIVDSAGELVGARQELVAGSIATFSSELIQRLDGTVQVVATEVVDVIDRVAQFGLVSQLYSASTGAALGPRHYFADQQLDFGTGDFTTLADGRVIGALSGSAVGSGDPFDIYVAVVGREGQLLTDIAVFSDQPVRDNYDPVMAATPDGGFVLAWTSEVPGSDTDRDVYIRRFDVDLNPTGASLVVNTDTTGEQFNAYIDVAPSGEVIVTWDSDDLVSAELEDVSARIFTLDDLGTPGSVINGTQGNDRLIGTAADDTLTGENGADFLDGGAGMDVMSGGLGNDFYIVNSLGDSITGEIAFSLGGGIDTVRSFADNYVQPDNIELVRLGILTGTGNLDATGNDAPGTLVGNAGNNNLTGRGGNDQINGNNGNDVLIGNTGRDTLVGGNGDDRFVFTAYADSRAGAANRDVINGFGRTAGQDDLIDLSTLDANTRTFGVDDAFDFIGGARFSGTAGELRYQALGGPNAVIIEADHNGDRVADLQIFVNLTTFMTGTDFIL